MLNIVNSHFLVKKTLFFCKKNSKNKIEKKIKNKKNVKNNVKPLPKKNPYGGKKPLWGNLTLGDFFKINLKQIFYGGYNSVVRNFFQINLKTIIAH